MFERQRLFVRPDLVDSVLAQICQQADRYAFVILAYCFMPDHLHLLVEGASDASDLPAFMKAWKQRTGFEYARRSGTRLWQVGYFDHVLRSDESTERHRFYVLGNPVRAGLAQVIGQYPFAGPYEPDERPVQDNHARTGDRPEIDRET